MFKIKDLYANESSLTDSGTIEVRFFKPYDEYDKIVVVDPKAGGIDEGVTFDGLTEKQVTLDIATALKNISEKDENNDVKFYYTRLSDVKIDDAGRQALIAETGADIVVGLSAMVSENAELSGIGCYYNQDYFLRKLTNAQFAGILETYCVNQTGAAGIFIEPADESDTLLMSSQLPAARVVVGVLNNDKDKQRLQDDAYKNKIAAGIYQGIVSAFEEMK